MSTPKTYDPDEAERALCAIWERWCAAQGLKCEDAEQVAFYAPTARQRRFARGFCDVWDEALRADATVERDRERTLA